MVVRTCSQLLPGENMAYPAIKGIFPIADIPEATDAIFCSAMPTCTNRSGNVSAKIFVRVEPVRSAQRATTFSFCSPASFSPSPYPLRLGTFSTSGVHILLSKCFANIYIMNQKE